MADDPSLQPAPPERKPWAILAFLVGFLVLLVFICFYYLLPALREYQHASHAYQQQMRAWSTLLLAILLIILLCGLMLTFRIGRFFFPRRDVRRTQTHYVDAWAEAGRRLEPPDSHDTK